MHELDLFLSTQSLSPSFLIARQRAVLREGTINVPENADVIPKYIKNSLTEMGFDFNAISFVMVNNGPGSFTGIRSGVAFAFGLGAVGNKAMATINSFDTIEICHLLQDISLQTNKQSDLKNTIIKSLKRPPIPVLIAIPFRGINMYTRIIYESDTYLEKVLTVEEIKALLMTNTNMTMVCSEPHALKDKELQEKCRHIEANAKQMHIAFSLIKEILQIQSLAGTRIFKKSISILNPQNKMLEPYYLAEPSIKQPSISTETACKKRHVTGVV